MSMLPGKVLTDGMICLYRLFLMHILYALKRHKSTAMKTYKSANKYIIEIEDRIQKVSEVLMSSN